MLKSNATKSMAVVFAMSILPAMGATNALADSSGWVTPDNLKKYSDLMKAEQKMPTSIACKGDSSNTVVRDSMQVNITFGPNPDHKKWLWVWGINFGKKKHDLLPQGWKLVSQSGFVRPTTGLIVRCGVFIGP